MRRQVLVLIAVAACKGGGSDAPGSDRGPGAARDPLLDVALPAGAARIEGKNFHVDAVALPGCAAGAVCTAFADLTSLAGFKVNREYPFKFVPDAATTLEGAAAFAHTGTNTGRLIIKFRRPGPEPTRVAGAFKLSVCSADVCQVETAQLAIAVP